MKKAASASAWKPSLQRCRNASTTKVYTWNEDENPYALLAKALKDAGITTGRIGVEERTQFAFSDGIAHASPSLTAVSGTPITFGCRGVKSPAELALMRLANDVTFHVYEAVYKSAQPGMTNRHFSELVSAAYNRVGFPGTPAARSASTPPCPTARSSRRSSAKSEIILIDDGCTVEGYQSDMSRTFVLGKATDKQKQVFDIVHKAQAAALAAGRPASSARPSTPQPARSSPTQATAPTTKLSHRLGHGIGMDGHEWPYLVRRNTTPLLAGMTFSDEPGIYITGEFGVRLEDDWVVTPNGSEMFTPQSPSLEDPFAKA